MEISVHLCLANLADIFGPAVKTYLLPSSCHPLHITKNIPFSLAYRILRICCSREKFLNHLEGLRQDLLSRFYHPKVIQDAFNKILEIPRAQALEKVKRSATNVREVLVATFHPSLPSITKTVQKHWKVMVDHSSRLKRCFEFPSLVAYKRPKNLRDILVRAKLNTRRSSRRKNGFNYCSRMCYACIQCERATSHSCQRTRRTWQITSALNCESRNVIYKIGCKKCKHFVYIGETERRFCDRLTDHRGYVNRKVLNHPVGGHFNKEGHDITDMIPIPIVKVYPENDDLLRRRREKLWIQGYDAVSFEGGNSRE